MHLASFWKREFLNSEVAYSKRTHYPSPCGFVRLCFTILGWDPPKCGDLSWLRFILSKQNITVATKEHIHILVKERKNKFKNLGFITTLSPDSTPVSGQLFGLCLLFHLLERKHKKKKKEKRKEREISSTNVKRNQSPEQKISKKKADRAFSKTNSILIYNF